MLRRSLPPSCRPAVLRRAPHEAPEHVEELKREIERLQDAKRRSLAIADDRAKEAVALRLENERLRAQLAERQT
jgi:hypothetical protein